MMKNLKTWSILMLVGFGILLVACGENKNAAAAEADEPATEEVATEETETTAVTADDAETPLAPDTSEGEVWTAIGGTYPYSDGTNSILVDSGIDGYPCLTINDEEYDATIDEETGLITATDEDGKVVFEGYMYDGACVLKGVLNGKSVRLNGMFGL